MGLLNKDNADEQTDSADKSQDTAAAAAETNASSLHQSRYQSAYGAWQTVELDL